MARTFNLSIVTPDGLFFSGEAESISVRTIDGDVCILGGHTDYVSPLGMGLARVKLDGKERFAASIGGMIVVTKGKVRLIATSFEWADEIDLQRALNSKAKAESDATSAEDDTGRALAKSRLARAQLRIGVSERYSKN